MSGGDGNQPIQNEIKRVTSVVYELVDLDVEEDDKSSEFYRSDLAFSGDKTVGTGSFGTVMQCIIKETNERVAIKKVLQDRKYKVFFYFLIYRVSESGAASYENIGSSKLR
jgi:hypothetical protein